MFVLFCYVIVAVAVVVLHIKSVDKLSDAPTILACKTCASVCSGRSSPRPEALGNAISHLSNLGLRPRA